MPWTTPTLLAACVVLLAALAADAHSDGLATVRVTTKHSQVLTGRLDAKTTRQALWLRRDAANGFVMSSVAWAEIASAELDGRAIEPAQLRSRVEQLASHRRPIDVLLSGADAAGTRAITPVSPRPRSRPPRQAVASIEIYPAAANWDADPQADGIELVLIARDRTGAPVAVRGELTAYAYGRRLTSRHRSQAQLLQTWREVVAPGDFHARTPAAAFATPAAATRAAVFRLPYRGLTPERDASIGGVATIEASLGVFGQGRFAASHQVRLRPIEFCDDRLERQTGIDLRGDRPAGSTNPYHLTHDRLR